MQPKKYKLWFIVLAFLMFQSSTQFVQAGTQIYVSPAKINKLPVSGFAPLFEPVSTTNVLGWANLLVDNTLPGNTSYTNTDIVTWAGQHGATIYQSFTDCSGLLTALLRQTYDLTDNEFKSWLGTKDPRASTYYSATINERGFNRITNINNVQSGDVISAYYLENITDTTKPSGHVMLVGSSPVLTTSKSPLVSGTQQWLVEVIDSTSSPHYKLDTRYISATNSYRQGLGRGTIRLYTDTNGVIVGYAWSTATGTTYYDDTTHPVAVGRLNTSFEL